MHCDCKTKPCHHCGAVCMYRIENMNVPVVPEQKKPPARPTPGKIQDVRKKMKEKLCTKGLLSVFRRTKESGEGPDLPMLKR